MGYGWAHAVRASNWFHGGEKSCRFTAFRRSIKPVVVLFEAGNSALTSSEKKSGAAGFLIGDSELASLIRSFNWKNTPLGPIEGWPISLKMATSLLLQSPIAIVMLWGPEGVMIYNDAYSRFGGARHPGLLGMKVREAWPEVADFNDNVLKVVLHEGKTLSYKDRELWLNRDGVSKQLWTNLDYSPIVDEHGQAVGVLSVVTETTERVLADRRIAAERERQQQSLDQMPGFVCVLSGPEHVYEYVNDAYLEIAGRTGFIGKTVREMFPELEGQGYLELLDQVYRTGKAVVHRAMELRLQASDELKFIDFVYQPIRDPEGSVTGIFVGGYEVSEAYRSTAALRASEARLRELNADLEREVTKRSHVRGKTWSLSPEILGVANSDGFFESVNPAWTEVLGWSADELAVMPFFNIVHPDDIESTKAGFLALQRGEPLLRFENRYRRKDGDYRWLSWVAVPDDGKFYCSARDITLEKDAQAELAIVQEALRQSQKMEAIGQLTGGIAHDFNNLLAGISGSLELLERRIAQGRLAGVERYIDAAQGSSRRAAALTQRLLAFSRRQTLDPKPTDVNKLVNGMEDLIRRTVGPAIRLEVVGAGGLWLTRIDPSQLENAVLNLAINARDAMPDGGNITIDTANQCLDDRAARQHELPPGQYVSLCVTDTGAGMSPDVIAQIFDPFFTTKPLGQGTGLGLSMIHGFVRQSGGQVRVTSEVGAGTTMCLYFPRFVGEAASHLPADASMPKEAAHGETVLVIDDEPTVRMLMREVLEEAGYITMDAGDGPSGLKVLRTDARIDLLVTDVGLPGGMNGRQVADAARTFRPDLKVLFVTGYAENASVANGHLDPGMQVIAKPFAMTDFANKVREMIEERKWVA